MTLTESEAPPEHKSAPPTLPSPEPATGVAGVLGSGDHKVIGRLFVLTSFLHLLIAGVTGAAMGIEKIDVSGLDVFDADVFAQTYSLHAVAGTFLFLLPLLVGIGIAVVPLQVGASAIAFPRAAAAAYWTYLVSGGVVVAAFVADGGPFGGSDDAVELFVAGFVGVVAALAVGLVCVATTTIALRAPDMGLHRTPLFAWSMLITAVVGLLTLPILVGVMVLVYVDLNYGPTFLGGADQVFARIAWAWGQPSVYLFAIPVLGAVGDIVPSVARTRLTLHRVAMGCIGAFGIFAFGAWAMPGFEPRNSPALPLEFVGEAPFYAFSALVALPVLVLLGLLADTMRRGTFRLASPLVWGLASVVMLLAGTGNGLLVSIEPFDLIGTSAQSAQIHYVLLAALLGAFAALAWWSPKVFGRTVAEGASIGLAVLGLLGTVLLCLPDLISGFLEQRWRLLGAEDDVTAIEALNVVSAIGGLIVVAVAVGFVALVAMAALGQGDVPDDPWEANTLEWATTSPPPPGNFTELPPIRSEAPLYDARHAAATEDS